MGLKQQLQLKQKQQLKLTQSLRRSIEIMQLDQDEIEALIQKEKEENPFLSLDEDHNEIAIDEKNESLPDVSQALSSSQSQDYVDQDEDYNNEYDEQSSPQKSYTPISMGRSFSSTADAGSVIEATYAYSAGFYEELETQIRLSLFHKKDRAIALFWLSQLDEKGRLPLKAYNQAKKVNSNEDDLTALLERLQQLEPVGLFARNLSECFKAQLIDREKWDSVWQNIFDNLKDISTQNINNMAQKMDIAPQLLAERLKYLKSLNPYPAWQGDEAEAKIIAPELIVFKHDNGQWDIRLNEEVFDPLILNELAFLQKQNIEATWLKAQQQKGQFLLQILMRRAQSLLKLGQVLLQEQVLFFEKGEGYLRPLTMSGLTEKLDMHESTISRLVRNKYLYFEGKAIELRWFFQSTRIAAVYGGDVSGKTVQLRIKKIIEKEPPNKPYSDDKLAQILNQDYGYRIARRTVLKYREAMNIPSSFERKRKYKNHL